jgi:hypothetical protein
MRFALSAAGVIWASLTMAAPSTAQQGGPIMIEPGMSQAQVEARLGRAVVERHEGAHTYLTFDNDCGKACGGDDLVILDNDAVVDAVFHTGRRQYTGASTPTTLTSTTGNPHTPPDPIRPASPADSAHRGGIVYMGPRPPVAAPKYDVVKPKQPDSTATPTPTPTPPARP